MLYANSKQNQSTNDNNLLNLLDSGINGMHLSVSAEAKEYLVRFIYLVDKWNKVYNLTAIRDPQKMISHHILDSLSVLPYVNKDQILDVGTGAGFPGIPLAICLPNFSFHLVDSSTKKMRFLKQVLVDLDIKNVVLNHTRIENMQPDLGFQIILTRAFSSLSAMLILRRFLCQDTGKILAMKGKYPDAELAAITQYCNVEIVKKLSIPALIGERHLVVLSFKNPAVLTN